MTTSILEQTRAFHEDVEIAEKVAARLANDKNKRPPKFRPLYDHAILRTLLTAQEASRRLMEIYADRDGLRKEEISILGGQKRVGLSDDQPEQNTEESGGRDDDRTVWLNFYDDLKSVKDSHKKTTNGLTDVLTQNEILRDTAALASLAVEACDADQVFTAEECLGRRVDMSTLFMEFTNLQKYRKHREAEYKHTELSRLRKNLQAKKTLNQDAIIHQLEEASELIKFQEIDYIKYLKIFDDFQSIPRHCKYRDQQYQTYLKNVLNYLQGLLKRINPLSNYDRMNEHFSSDFSSAWEKKSIPSWEIPTHNLPMYALPTDHLFATEGTLNSHKQGKKYKKALSLMQSQPMKEQQQRIVESEAEDRRLAEMEFLIQRYKDILSSVIQRTVEHLQKKQSRTLRELEVDQDESDTEENISTIVLARKENEPEDSDSDGEDRPIYNPLNLPLGWDGKPIPFWLYKLHGLGVEYKCEICGNYSYWGRRAFERHFQEWRHAFGMRCLKIPNTMHFKEITKIEEAVLLYDKLKKEAEIQAFKADQDVECEDAEGNVMSAKTFEDLRRQGLL